MNPKEVSYSHPQLPLCDTPKFEASEPFACMRLLTKRLLKQ